MTKIYCIFCDKTRKFEMIKVYYTDSKKYKKIKKPKISYIFEKILLISIICNNCGTNH